MKTSAECLDFIKIQSIPIPFSTTLPESLEQQIIDIRQAWVDRMICAARQQMILREYVNKFEELQKIIDEDNYEPIFILDSLPKGDY